MLKRLADLAKEKTVKIVGHKNPDFDSIVSGILLGIFLRANNINAEFVCDGVSDSNTLSALEYVGINVNDFCKGIKSDDFVFFVDHHSSEYEFDNFIVGCVDHHQTNSAVDIPIYFNAPSSSCAMNIFHIAQKEGFAFERNELKLIVMSIYMDTRSCKSTKFIESDREFIIETAKEYSFEGELDIFERFGYCLTDMTKPIEKLAETDMKEYFFAGNKIIISHLQVMRNPSVDGVLKEICAYATSECQKSGIGIWIIMVSDPNTETTEVIRIDGKSVENKRYTKLLSRSTDVIPALEKEFNL